MGFEDDLVPGEKLIVRTGVHWVSFCVRPFAAFFFAFILGVLGLYLKFSAFYFVSAFFAFVGLLFAFIDWLYFRASRYYITTRRVVSQKGFLSRSVVEMQLSQVESVSVYQPVLAVAFGYGFVYVSGAGGRRVACNWVPDPNRFKNSINKQLGGGLK